MILVLFFLGLIIFLLFFFVVTSVIWLQIDIKNFKLYKEENKKRKVNEDFEVLINGYVFKKIKIFQYKINSKSKFSTEHFNKIKNRIDLSVLKKFFSKNFDDLNVKNIEINCLDLYVNLGTENVILTSGLVTIFNILISVFLPKTSNSNPEQYKYEIKPIYENINKLELFLESKIRFRLFSIIKALKNFKSAKEKFV